MRMFLNAFWNARRARTLRPMDVITPGLGGGSSLVGLDWESLADVSGSVVFILVSIVVFMGEGMSGWFSTS